jgi:2-oxoglutarate dehydrogenase E1 component
MSKDFSFISNAHPSYIESLYRDYVQDPNSIDPSWSVFFTGFDYAGGAVANGNATGNGQGVVAMAASGTEGSVAIPQKEISVMMLIDGYRHRAHLLSTTNPLRPRKDRQANLKASDYGLDENDMGKVFHAGTVLGLKNATLKQIIDKLNAIYCGNIGFEYSHIENSEKRAWLREQIENRQLTEGYGFPIERKRRILEKLNEAVGFEEFLGKKFIGKKRFSLEGGESTIPALDAIISTGADNEVKEVVIGMAHRGRLNVLANIMRKTYDNIFNEFDEAVPELVYGSGDVKYHLGFSSQVTTPASKSVYLKLLPNPSHLEAVDPLVVGYSRAKADILYNSEYGRILPIMIHGDAAVAGQGIVYEAIQMSLLPGYFAGGTIHFVINNQIGFTTNFDDARSSTYSTSVGNVVQAPTFHVNGDDPEAVVWASELAVAYRQRYNNDVFIDMVCYRKHGHNESDNAEFTQPLMWRMIKDHLNPRDLYIQQLTNRSEVTREMAEQLKKEYDDFLQERLQGVKQGNLPYKHQEPEQAWRSLKKITSEEDYASSPDTGISKESVDTILKHLMTVPSSFSPLKDILRYLQGKQKILDGGKVDWGYGELMAYGSILLENKNVRLSGEDVKRGTFSHRHACFFDAETGGEYNRLNTISNKQGQFYIYNSFLSEYAVMGFEYGYAMASPDALVIWEAQFGDFHNGAQTIIDQFIAAGESKWQRQNGLVLLLPHGYEGQGPEHSSARLERFIQLCAENNMTIANVTTPANFFHLMRRQLARPFRKPLVVMSPKSLLRHPECVSDLKDFEVGNRFQEVIDDPSVLAAEKVKKVLFCSGKLYYELLAKQKADNVTDIAIVRLEQLYPFPENQVKELLKKYSNAKPYWVQEEPQNNGAWFHIALYHGDLGMTFIGRPASASPASGFVKIHNKEQEKIITKAFE